MRNLILQDLYCTAIDVAVKDADQCQRCGSHTTKEYFVIYDDLSFDPVKHINSYPDDGCWLAVVSDSDYDQLDINIYGIPPSERPNFQDTAEKIVKDHFDSLSFDLSSQSDDIAIDNPVINRDLFTTIIQKVGFEITDNTAKHNDIGKMQISEDSELRVSVSNNFDTSQFNLMIQEYLDELMLDRWEDIHNPYPDVIDRENLALIFAKYGDTATEFWRAFSDRIFTKSPIEQLDKCLESYICNEKQRFQYLRIWSDIVEMMRYTNLNISHPKLIGSLKSHLANILSVDESEIAVPWIKESYQNAKEQIIEKYNYEDLSYNREVLSDNIKIRHRISDKYSVIHKTKYYGKYPNKRGILLPDGWVSEVVGIVGNRPDVHRFEMQDKLSSMNHWGYLSKDAVESRNIVTRDMNPVVLKDGTFSQIGTQLNKKQIYEENIQKCLNNSYNVKTVRLREFVEQQKWNDGFDGWHTATVCSEFPIRLGIDGGSQSVEQEPFSEGGVATYKTKLCGLIEPNWSKIINSSVNKNNTEQIRREIRESEYSLDDTVVITLHNLPWDDEI